MSPYDKVMPNASPLVSRRLFARRALGGVAGGVALLAPSRAFATEPGFLNEETPAPPVAEGTVTSEAEEPAAPEAAVTSGGQIIVDFAWQYLGYPYVYAGNGPGGFDCSGFTQFVLINTLGIDIGHASSGQFGSGAWVDAGNLLPGDEVFFANTYGAGVSHTGFYIGDGQFIHAENESTGVCISWLWSDYYGGHYYGANRHW